MPHPPPSRYSWTNSWKRSRNHVIFSDPPKPGVVIGARGHRRSSLILPYGDSNDNYDGPGAELEMERQPTIEEIVTEPSNIYSSSYEDIVNHEGMLEYPLDQCPANVGSFVPDILCMIFMFLAKKEDVLAVSGTCQMWRFYANYLPHWTQLRHTRRLFNIQLPGFFEKDIVRTRDDLLVPYRKTQKAKREMIKWKERKSTIEKIIFAIFTRFLLPSGVLALVLVIHFAIAWAMGIQHNGSYGDSEIAAGTTITFLFVTFAEFFIAAFFIIITDRVDGAQAHIVRIMTVICIITFTVLVPVAMVGGRMDSAEDIVDGKATSMAQRGRDLQELEEVPVRSYFQLDHSLGEQRRWAHFPTGRNFDDRENTEFWCGTCTSPIVTSEMVRDGANMTRSIHYRSTYDDEGGKTDYKGSFFVLYDVDTKPKNANNSISEWGTAVDPRGVADYGKAEEGPYRSTEKSGCYNRSLFLTSSQGYKFMNCLYDYAQSPEWKGTMFIAIRGTPEDFAYKYYRKKLRDATAVSYRTVRRTANFNSEYSYLEAFWWQRSKNRWWREGGVYLIETDWPETIEEGQERVDRHWEYRNQLILAIAVMGVSFNLLPFFFSDTDKGRAACVGLTMILGIVIVNPLSVGGIGIACVGRTDDPRTRDESWLMCQPPAGGGLIFIAICLFPFCGIVIAIVSDILYHSHRW